MAWTFKAVLTDDLIHVVAKDLHAGFFQIRLGVLRTVVTIELGRYMRKEDRRTKYWVSHAIHTPLLAAPYITSLPLADDPPSALRRAVFGLTDDYRAAVMAGHEPQEQWLVRI